MELRGIKIDNWSLSFQEDYFIEELPVILFPEVASKLYESDFEFQSKPLPKGDETVNYCQWLREKSIQALNR